MPGLGLGTQNFFPYSIREKKTKKQKTKQKALPMESMSSLELLELSHVNLTCALHICV